MWIKKIYYITILLYNIYTCTFYVILHKYLLNIVSALKLRIKKIVI